MAKRATKRKPTTQTESPRLAAMRANERELAAYVRKAKAVERLTRQATTWTYRVDRALTDLGKFIADRKAQIAEPVDAGQHS